MSAPRPGPGVAELSRRLGHCFADSKLVTQALTHRSAGGAHYERLEFLGDSVLGLIISAELLARHPQAPEGDLSRLRSALVRERTLAQIAQELELGNHLNMGPGETRNGSSRRASILADVVESLIGAVFLDAGFATARTIVLGLYAQRLDNLPSAESLKDPKTRLQEWLQARTRPVPEYNIINVAGESHNQTFTASCTLVDEPRNSEGVGPGRRRAEQAAARNMLEQLDE